MSILSHNIYDNVRTRVIVTHDGAILLLPGVIDGKKIWGPPGGGIEPHESLAECAAREVREETGIAVDVWRIAFLREWVVPAHCTLPEAGDGVGFGIEVAAGRCQSRDAQRRTGGALDPSPRHPLAPSAAQRAEVAGRDHRVRGCTGGCAFLCFQA